MIELSFKQEKIAFEKLRLETNYDETVPSSLRYRAALDSKPEDSSPEYTLLDVAKFTPDVLSILMKLHPIFAIRRRGKVMVVAGKRTFHAASKRLDPGQEVTIYMLDEKTTRDQLLFLRYLDITVSSLIFRQNATMATIYKSINLPALRKKAWLKPLESTMQPFAAALGTSTASLCTPPNKTLDNGHSADETSKAEEQS